MEITVNVIGATGLIGRQLVGQLTENPRVGLIRLFTRRASGFRHAKIEERIVDFDDEQAWQSMVTGDILYSTLGTTLQQAGSKEAQYKVDYLYQYQFARAAAANGVKTYALISSAGADPGSFIFYSRMKGELDLAVQQLPFRQCVILRPSILAGIREVERPAESLANRFMAFVTQFAFRRYRPNPDHVVAKALINATLHSEISGVQVITLDEIFRLANQ
jgi:uncharacterized protein YbjT (DUF2867 family)